MDVAERELEMLIEALSNEEQRDDAKIADLRRRLQAMRTNFRFWLDEEFPAHGKGQ